MIEAHAYYNEFDPYAAQWLRNLIAAGYIAPGVVDERSITDVDPSELLAYTQCHFFAGIGGWSYAARLAGWPDDRPLWTGSCPCQPFSVAGGQKGQADERHLWPTFFNLIRAVCPPVVMGEQVAAAIGKDWLDGVYFDLESVGYTARSAVVPACAVDAPHRRDRLWFVADTVVAGLEGHAGHGGRGDRRSGPTGPATTTGGGAVPHANGSAGEQGRPIIGRRDQGSGTIERAGSGGVGGGTGQWSGAVFAIGADGKARRIEPSIRLLAHGISARVGKLRAYGNAIVPQVAAEVIGAYSDDIDDLRLGVFG